MMCIVSYDCVTCYIGILVLVFVDILDDNER